MPPDILGQNFGVPSRRSRIFRCATPSSRRVARRPRHGPRSSERTRRAATPLHLLAWTHPGARPGITVHIADTQLHRHDDGCAALEAVPEGCGDALAPNADEWQYWIKGKGQMTVFNTGPNRQWTSRPDGTATSRSLSITSRTQGIPTCSPRSIQARISRTCLFRLITRTPPAMVAQHLNAAKRRSQIPQGQAEASCRPGRIVGDCSGRSIYTGLRDHHEAACKNVGSHTAAPISGGSRSYKLQFSSSPIDGRLTF
jgi:oxalate decarboxylase